MKRKIFFLILFAYGIASGQSQKEIEAIKSTYNKNEISSLIKNFNAKYSDSEKRIKNYLLSHPNQTVEYVDSKGNLCRVVDIVNNQPIIITTDNYLAAVAYRTNQLYPGGTLGLSLDGTNMTVGMWDGGWALKTHTEFMNSQTPAVTRITVGDGIGATSDFHATHVAGTIIAKGVSSSARGMAPKASLVSYTWDNDIAEVTMEASNNALLISNHSYGIPIFSDGTQVAPNWLMGCYTSEAADWDALARTMPYYLMVTSAGNSGGDEYTGGIAPGYDKLTSDKNAKNILVVANANPTVHPITGAFSSLLINPSSSQGPSDDGRIKPDIAGDGTNVYSASNASNTSYETSSGTSMASPGVAGSLLLLQQHYNNLNSAYMRSSTLKAVVCHTALDDTASVGPDPRFGYGFLDAKASAQLITNANNAVPTAIIQENSLSQGGSYTFNVVVNNPQTLKATLCWIDPQGNSHDNELNSTTPALVNDLDIRIIKNTETNYPWKLQLSDVTAPAIKGDNIVDNVEKVEVENASGTYTIQITHKGIMLFGPQAYSLVVSGFDQAVLKNSSYQLSGISVYPNPANDILNIDSSKTLVKGFEIYDIQGRMVNSGITSGTNLLSVDLQMLNSGVYFVKVLSEEGTFTQKFIKK